MAAHDIIKSPGLVWPVKSIGGLGLGCCCGGEEVEVCGGRTVPLQITATFESGYYNEPKAVCEALLGTSVQLDYSGIISYSSNPPFCAVLYEGACGSGVARGILTFQSYGGSPPSHYGGYGSMYYRQSGVSSCNKSGSAVYSDYDDITATEVLDATSFLD